MKCLSLNGKVNSQGCADDYSCIDKQDNYKCILMNPSTSLGVVGRESSTDYCIPEGNKIASLCKTGYCLYNYACQKL